MIDRRSWNASRCHKMTVEGSYKRRFRTRLNQERGRCGKRRVATHPETSSEPRRPLCNPTRLVGS